MKTYHKVIVLGLALLLPFMFIPNPPHNRLSDVPLGNWVLIAHTKDFSTVLDEDTVVLIEHSLLSSLSQDRRTALTSLLEDGYPVAVVGRSIRPNLLADELELNLSGSYGSSSKIVANGLFRIPEGRYISFYVDGAVSTNEDISCCRSYLFWCHVSEVLRIRCEWRPPNIRRRDSLEHSYRIYYTGNLFVGSVL